MRSDRKNCGKSRIPIRPDLSPILSVTAEYQLGGNHGQSLISAMSDSVGAGGAGGAGGVKCYNVGHFPPIRQDGGFNYVLQAVLCMLKVVMMLIYCVYVLGAVRAVVV